MRVAHFHQADHLLKNTFKDTQQRLLSAVSPSGRVTASQPGLQTSSSMSPYMPNLLFGGDICGGVATLTFLSIIVLRLLHIFFASPVLNCFFILCLCCGLDLWIILPQFSPFSSNNASSPQTTPGPHADPGSTMCYIGVYDVLHTLCCII